ncbi:serpin family protein [Paenibacillus kobensis]|uniref:serpin family protein n=1 Tax=Paenibacillus kobensis TaxID=59841 RepID=UPI0013E34D1C|nr:serpin family protein [Paenibacillus kobensis]
MRMRTFIASAAIAATVLTSGCSSATNQHKPITLEQREQLSESIDQTIVQSSNHFGLRLHEQLVKSESGHNVFLSPLSISTAFAMAANGSKGDTLNELLHVLGWDGKSAQDLNAAYQQLLSLISEPGAGVELRIANSMWSDKKAALLTAFTDTLHQYYGAEPKQADFTDPHNTAKQINGWVSEHTNSMIKKLLDADSVNPDTVLMLLNAIYFNGEWKEPFRKSDTSDAPFHLIDGSDVTAAFMSQSGQFEYKKTDSYEAIRLPYGEGQMAMTIVLPANGKTLDDFQQLLWNGKITVSDRFAKHRGSIRLPKFKMEYSAKLNDALQKLGMKLPFDSNAADLSGITGKRDLVISKVLHKSIIEVSEEGTEAAAVTSIETVATSAPAVDPVPFNMNVNRPFYFAIEDLQSGVQLFTGSMYNPASASDE